MKIGDTVINKERREYHFHKPADVIIEKGEKLVIEQIHYGVQISVREGSNEKRRIPKYLSFKEYPKKKFPISYFKMEA